MRKRKTSKSDLALLDDLDIDDPFIEPDITPTILTATPALSVPNATSLNVIEQLEKAGYREIGNKLKELQLKHGIDSLQESLDRMSLIEAEIDKLLVNDIPLNPMDLKTLAGIVSDMITLRAKALLLPMGAVHPKNVLPRQSTTPMNLQVGLAIGGGIMPRKK